MNAQPFQRNTDGRLCDVVMKGGITSGIVYPKAIVELAKKFEFKNIGGTSAGAIPAPGAPAAEWGRARGGGGAGVQGLGAESPRVRQRARGGTEPPAAVPPQ